jgi:hypothetical protein
MPVAYLDGPLGLEGKHIWQSAPTLTMNDRKVNPQVAIRYRIRNITGLFDLPSLEDNAEAVTEGIGDYELTSRARSRLVTYEFDVEAPTLQMLRRGAAEARAAFGPDLTTGKLSQKFMEIAPQTEYDAGLKHHIYSARVVSYVQGTDVQEYGPSDLTPYETAAGLQWIACPWRRPVVLALRALNPRIYELNDPGGARTLGPAKW